MPFFGFIEIKEKVIESLRMLLSNDEMLLKDNASENSISHRFAIYLENNFRNYNVDFEYNRLDFEKPESKVLKNFKSFPVVNWLDDKFNIALFKKIWKKKFKKTDNLCSNLINRIRIDTNVTKKNNEDKCVRPDIIVHKRKKKMNILACEIKKSTNYSRHEILYDLLKLEFYCIENSLEYDYGIFVRFFIGKTNKKFCDIIWFIREEMFTPKEKLYECYMKKDLRI